MAELLARAPLLAAPAAKPLLAAVAMAAGIAARRALAFQARAPPFPR